MALVGGTNLYRRHRLPFLKTYSLPLQAGHMLLTMKTYLG